MTKWRITIKPEGSEPLMMMKVDTEEDADRRIAIFRERQAELFAKTKADLLIVIKEELYKDEWREEFRDSLLRP